jgi:glucose-6-phosphate isomerase
MTELSLAAADEKLAATVLQLADRARAEGLPAKLAGGDPTLWGPEAESEAKIRLGWIDLGETSRELVPRLVALRDELAADGIDRVVLAGMGGSSLAPEVICRTAGAELIVVDTTDPGQVAAALTEELERTVVVVSSKSGGTVETDSHRRAAWAAFEAAGIRDVGRHFVAVTDPGSPLAAAAEEAGFRAVVLADPDVGGRYSALTAFGLVPSVLAGVDVVPLLDQAAALRRGLSEDEHNPALDLGLALGAAWTVGRDKVVIADTGSGVVGFGDWAEQLVAESTGKEGKGLLPVVVEGPTAPGTSGPDVALVTVGPPGDAPDPVASVAGPLGAQFLAWEYAVAVAGWAIGINPFDQPNVQESKDNTARILESGPPVGAPAFTAGAVQVHGDPALLDGADTLTGAIAALCGAIPDRGYLAIMAYLDRENDASAADLRGELARVTGKAVTFGWAPRFLHSTGQYHKGGPQVGAFLQLTAEPDAALEVPGRPYDFTTLQAAQAAGDRQALAQRNRPLLHLHLTDRAAGLGQLLEAVP